MKAPKLKKRKNVKFYHGYKVTDYYSWVHQKDIMNVLSNPKCLLEETKTYLQDSNKHTAHNMKEQKNLR